MKIEEAMLDTCTFAGKAALHASGRPPKRAPDGTIIPKISSATKEVVPCFTEFKRLTLRKTPLCGPNFDCGHLGQLSLEDTSLSDASFAHGEIGRLSLTDVTLGGSLDLRDTEVRQLSETRVRKVSLSVLRSQGQKDLLL